jgi:molecular chaperone DnaJ
MRTLLHHIHLHGSGRGPGGAARGGDVNIVVPLTFMEAAHGCTKDLNVAVNSSCDTCHGSGAADGAKPTTCPTCRGTGTITMQSGFFAASATCRRCGGEGTIISNPCKTCSGRGVTKKQRTVQVVVPPGVDTGTNLRVPGQGHAGPGGGAGHLYVTLEVTPDPFFERDDADVHVTIPITVAQAVLGATVTVPTVRGEVELKIPPGTQPSDKLAIRGRGLPRLNGGPAGNQYVHLKVLIPKSLTKEQRELLEKYAALDADGAAAASTDAGSASSFLKSTLERIRRAIRDAGSSTSSSSGSGGSSSGAGGAGAASAGKS